MACGCSVRLPSPPAAWPRSRTRGGRVTAPEGEIPLTRWALGIGRDKWGACRGCSIPCRFENNPPPVKPSEALKGRAVRWNDVFPLPINPTEETGDYPNVRPRFLTRPCMHCDNPPCVKVCPVQATCKNEEGVGQ